MTLPSASRPAGALASPRQKSISVWPYLTARSKPACSLRLLRESQGNTSREQCNKGGSNSQRPFGQAISTGHGHAQKNPSGLTGRPMTNRFVGFSVGSKFGAMMLLECFAAQKNSNKSQRRPIPADQTTAPKQERAEA